MDMGFRLLLRVALVLVLLAGVGLVVYAVIGGGPPGQPALERPDGGPAPQVAAAPAQETSPPSPAPVQSESPQPPEQAQSTQPEGPRDVELEMVECRIVLRDEEAGRDEAIVEGARILPRETLYEVFSPVVDLIAPPEDGTQLDVQVHNVRITAQMANVARDHSSLRLFKDVTACGKGFQIATASVVYSTKNRTLTSNDTVRIQRNREGEGDPGTPAMVVTGEGLFVDATIEDMSILKNVEARLYNVSEDFLADAAVPDEPAAEVLSDVLITCAGQMNYQHPARRVVFHNAVRADWGGKTLNCDKLTIVLAEAEGTDSLQVEQVVASGSVQLSHERQIARGETLNWHNVTQTAALTGQPAVLSTAELELTGRELTLYRVNVRFQSEGAGTLYWKAPAPEPQAPKSQPTQSAFGLGPMGLTNNAPISVTWNDAMKYDRDEQRAVFNGAVSASQGGLTLDCDQLLIEFGAGASRIGKVQADGHVKMHDALSAPGRDVLCERLLWDATRDTVELTAPEGGLVNVTAGRNVIASERVALDNRAGTLACLAPGELTAAAGPQEREGPDGQAAPPLSVKWQESMRFCERPSPKANFRGQVVARRGPQQIRGESLDVDFDPDMNVLRALAGGGAVIDIRSRPQRPSDAAGPALPGVAEVEADHWHLEAREVTILPPEDVLASETAGALTVLSKGVTTATIRWNKNMRVSLPGGFAHFQGQTKANVSGAELQSDSLKLDFTPERKPRHIWAEGSVQFVSRSEDGWQLRSDSAEAVFDAQGELRQVIARGHVQVQDPAYTLTSEVLTLHTAPDEQQDKPVLIERAVAERNVHVRYLTEGELETGGDRLEWERRTDIFVLTGEPEAYWRYGDLRHRSPRMLFDRATGRMHSPPSSRPIRTEATHDPL